MIRPVVFHPDLPFDDPEEHPMRLFRRAASTMWSVMPSFILILVVSNAMNSSVWAEGVEIVGHRGASHDAPENTLAAVKLSWEQGADATEFDVYLTKDGRIVAHHDETTERTAGVDRPVVEQTLEELRKLDAGSWKGAKFAGERIPTLEEVLGSIPRGKRVFIEIKCGAEIIPELERVLAEVGKPAAATAVIGFSFEAMTAIKQALPELKVYWVQGLKRDEKTGEWTPRVDDLIAQARAAGLDGIDLKSTPPVNRESIAKAHAAGLEFYVWTVNDVAEAIRVRDAGVDGITTDRPGWLREQLQSR